VVAGVTGSPPAAFGSRPRGRRKLAGRLRFASVADYRQVESRREARVPHQTAARMPDNFPIKIGHPHIIDSGGQMAKLNKKISNLELEE
jgi:hypothetical protein